MLSEYVVNQGLTVFSHKGEGFVTIVQEGVAFVNHDEPLTFEEADQTRVYKINRNGLINRYKGLANSRYKQQYGIEYVETFSPLGLGCRFKAPRC